MKSDKRKLVPESKIRTLAFLSKNRKITSFDKPYKAMRGKLNREGWDD